MTSFVDANVLVKAFTNNADQEKCNAVLNERFVTNVLCVLEAQNAIAKIAKSKLHAAACVKSLFRSSGLIAPVDKNLLFLSLKIIDEKLSAFDSVNYATALLNNCSEIVSYDRDFDNLAIKRTEP